MKNQLLLLAIIGFMYGTQVEAKKVTTVATRPAAAKPAMKPAMKPAAAETAAQEAAEQQQAQAMQTKLAISRMEAEKEATQCQPGQPCPAKESTTTEETTASE